MGFLKEGAKGRLEAKDGPLFVGCNFWAVDGGVVVPGTVEQFPVLAWTLERPRGVLSGGVVYPPKACFVSELAAREHAVAVLRESAAQSERSALAAREDLDAALIQLDALKRRQG